MFGFEGDTIASALHAEGIKTLSTSLKYNNPRGFFCGIGKCSSCLMRVNDIPNVRTCIAPLKENVRVEIQDKLPDLPNATFKELPIESLYFDVLIIGAGPAGLCAAIEAAQNGARVLIVDENQKVGGQLIKQTHKFFGSKHEKAGTRGIDIAKELEKELNILESQGKISVMLDSTIMGYYESRKNHLFGVLRRKEYKSQFLEINCKAAIVACGAMENMILFPNNDLPGVYGAGAVQTLMNVYGVKPGKNVLMVGAGNVGLIVSYQLLQAGIKVDRIVEAAPIIGGYHVHAAKLRRCGVPIYTSHSIKEVIGKEYVEGAVVVQLDKDWQPINGSEVTVECDTICLAVGLTPSTRILSQINVDMEIIPEAGGYVAVHDESMKTSVKNIYVCGDSSGIEEASTAMIEGKIAGLSSTINLEITNNRQNLIKYKDELNLLRAGPFGNKPRTAKKMMNKLVKKQNV